MSNHVLLKPAPRLAAAPSESTDYRIQAPNVELDEVGARLLQPPPLPAAFCTWPPTIATPTCLPR